MAIADASGLPLALHTDSASPHEVTPVRAALDEIVTVGQPGRSIGDRAHDSDPPDNAPAAQGIGMMAPHRRNRKHKATPDGRPLRRYRRRQASRHNQAYARDIAQRLERHVLPSFDGKPITEISPREILALLQQVANGGLAETARRLRQYMSRIFRFAIVTERAEHDPAAVLLDALPSPMPERMAARTRPAEVKAVFRACQYYAGAVTVRHALLFQTLTAARPGMVNAAEWAEMDLNAAVWTVRANKMKTRRDFRVPLSATALAILQNQAPLTGGHQYVFEGRDRTRPLSGNTMRQALRSMGFLDHVPHGWRAAFSSVCNEYGHKPDAIEMCLAHEQRNRVRAAYNRAELWDERRTLMEWWANFLTSSEI